MGNRFRPAGHKARPGGVLLALRRGGRQPKHTSEVRLDESPESAERERNLAVELMQSCPWSRAGRAHRPNCLIKRSRVAGAYQCFGVSSLLEAVALLDLTSLSGSRVKP